MSRTVFQITYNCQARAWVAAVYGAPVLCDSQKAGLIKQVSNECVAMRILLGHNSQIVIHGRDGRIQSERTYGNDPRRSKG